MLYCINVIVSCPKEFNVELYIIDAVNKWKIGNNWPYTSCSKMILCLYTAYNVLESCWYKKFLLRNVHPYLSQSYLLPTQVHDSRRKILSEISKLKQAKLLHFTIILMMVYFNYSVSQFFSLELFFDKVICQINKELT